MSNKASLKAFECPSCGAPLEVREREKTVTCRYCHMMVSVPQDPDPIIIEVPRRVPTSARRDWDAEEKQKQLVIAYSLVGVIFVFLIFSFLSKPSEPLPPTSPVIVYNSPIPTHTLLPPYADHILTFDTNIDPSSSVLLVSKDIDLDADGNLLVTEYDNSSMVYKFDPEGNFLSKEFETDYNITSFSMGPDKGIITTFGFDVHFYKNGNEELVLPNQFANDVVFGKDGSFYVIGHDQTIFRYDPTGEVNLEIDKVFETQLNSKESESHLAVDDLGNMYLLGVSNGVVLKFAPDGSLLGKIDGKDSGYFSYPKSIAVDSAGRIFIGEFRRVLVFNEGFRFVDTLTNIEDFYLQALVVDDENHLYLLTDENTVRKYQLPAVSQ